MDIDIAILRAARAALKAIREREAAYQADVDDWYQNGDGARPNWQRSGDQPWFNPEMHDPERMVNLGGKNYTYPRCIHGMSRWTDFDNICGGCEDSTRATEMAVQMGASAVLTCRERIAASMPAIKAGCPRDIIDALMTWACEEPFKF